MSYKTELQEQVNALTSEQKQNVFKAYKIKLVAFLCICIPTILFDIYATLMFLDTSVSESRRDSVLLLFCIVTVVAVIAIAAVLLYIKSKYPYFSDKLYSYMKKHPENIG